MEVARCVSSVSTSYSTEEYDTNCSLFTLAHRNAKADYFPPLPYSLPKMAGHLKRQYYGKRADLPR
jgi:hypothetical protein